MIEPSSCSVAVVAADGVLREALGMSLSARGFAVSAFTGIAAFLKGKEAASPDCLIVDLSRAGGKIEGDEAHVTRQIAAEFPSLPVILLTSSGRDDAGRTRNLVLLTKPVSPDLISRHILKAAAAGRMNAACNP